MIPWVLGVVALLILLRIARRRRSATLTGKAVARETAKIDGGSTGYLDGRPGSKLGKFYVGKNPRL
jgi:hypothetical protein